MFSLQCESLVPLQERPTPALIIANRTEPQSPWPKTCLMRSILTSTALLSSVIIPHGTFSAAAFSIDDNRCQDSFGRFPSLSANIDSVDSTFLSVSHTATSRTRSLGRLRISGEEEGWSFSQCLTIAGGGRSGWSLAALHPQTEAAQHIGDGTNPLGGIKCSKGRRRRVVATVAAGASFVLVVWGCFQRHFVAETLKSFEFKTWLIEKLDAANAMGIGGLVLYSLLFAVWEITIGITTPVETAAGMAFGLKKGIVASAIGKTGGSITAFLLGRSLLRDYVRKKLYGNEMMDLVRDSIMSNPVGVALVWRFSFLPEFVKNFGLAVLPLRPIYFIAAVILHGFPFTCLWTYLGAETGALARGVVKAPSRSLKILLSVVNVFGFVISPTLVGMWVKSLKDKQRAKQEDEMKGASQPRECPGR